MSCPRLVLSCPVLPSSVSSLSFALSISPPAHPGLPDHLLLRTPPELSDFCLIPAKAPRGLVANGGILLRLCLPPHLQMTNPILSTSLRVLRSISFHLLSSPCLSGSSGPSPVLLQLFLFFHSFLRPPSFTPYLQVLILFSPESTPFNSFTNSLPFLHSFTKSIPAYASSPDSLPHATAVLPCMVSCLLYKLLSPHVVFLSLKTD